MKLTVALLALLLAPTQGSFLPKDAIPTPKAVVASTAKESPHIVPVPAKTAATLPTPHGHPEAAGAKKVAPKPVAAAAKVEAKPVVAKVTDKVSPHIVPVPAKPAVKLPAPASHKEGPQTKKAADAAPKPVVAIATAKAAPLPDPKGAKPKVEAKPVVPVVAIAKPAAKVEVVKAVAKAVEAKEARKVAVKPVEAAPKPVAKVEAKPVVAKVTDKVSPHIVPVPAKTAAKLPAPVGHPEGPQSKKAADAAPKPAAKVEAKPVPHAAVAVAVTHTKAEPAAKPAADASKTKLGDEGKGPGVPKPMTIHDHAVSAQNSADEATKHLEAAKKAYAMTKANVQDTLKAGKKIEGTAGKIKTLYTPPKPPPAKESAARSVAVPAALAMLVAAVLSQC